ncbi:MAG: hypothetical protein ABXS93_06760, partial [Sulfurimonas sp.]
MKKISKTEFDNFYSKVKKKYITEIALEDEEYQWLISADEIFQSVSDLNNQHHLLKQEIELAKKCSEIIFHFLVPQNLGYSYIQKSLESLYCYMDDDVNYCMFVSVVFNNLCQHRIIPKIVS